ncbi:E3 ubiquitin-protein ligase SINA-like 7 [Panicum miliaceum]|uniref:E3 ubiquitin-protein ligase SINA-like 7 n=1 Tax=Panicum miliaceum TaxID=4540 RepID=A0A3L6RWN9_PANMI|nr:E3 ubiquitin-protein ligase SINA-like 7 [Panicum miliaceum]
MAASGDWEHEDEIPVDERLKILSAAAGEPKRKRARPCDAAGGGREAASGSASVEKEEPSSGAAAAARVRPESAAAATAVVAVEDTDALDCGVCFLPLKPPIFQCAVGHVVCSPCHDKLEATAKCYVCGDATGGYQRCYAMERMVESVRVP